MATKDDDWTWVSQHPWALDNVYWPRFCAYWRDNPLEEPPTPYHLTLHQVPIPSWWDTTILITRSYQDIFARVQGLRQARPISSAVVTGQPGTGKTTWLWYALIRLISEGEQVIVFCVTGKAFLFYFGKVYSRTLSSGVVDLPTHTSKRRIIELLDIDQRVIMPDGVGEAFVWPILASSPIPSRFHILLTQRSARIVGMPLWTLDELVQGLPLQQQYATFVRNLRVIRAGGLNDDGVADAAAAGDAAANEAHRIIERSRMGDTEGDADDTDVDAGEEPLGLPTFEEDIRTLVDVKTVEFGFAPRDVYTAVFDPAMQRTAYTDTVRNVDYQALKAAADALRKDHSLPASNVSHQVLAVHPYPRANDHDRWDVKFKSVYIAQLVMKEMVVKENCQIQEQYKVLHEGFGSSSLAGSYFEALGHRLNSGDHSLPRFAMSRTGESNSPNFTFSPPGTPSTSRGQSPREIMYFDVADLSTMQLDHTKYYIPAASNNPLFDAFTIAFDVTKQPLSVVISAFQMTISAEHGGSSKGYGHIRKIVALTDRHVKASKLVKQSTKAKDYIKVEYVLVCPADQSQPERVWRMPTGWNEGVARYDHRGSVFCLIVPDNV